MAHLIKYFTRNGLTEAAAQSIIDSWAPATRKQYDCALRKWVKYAREQAISASDPSAIDITNFLSQSAKSGLSYNSLSISRAALGAYLPVINQNAGAMLDSPLILRFMKGVFKHKPPTPKYASIWDIDIVLNMLDAWGKAEDLQIKQLTLRLTMLLALASPKRCSELSHLTMENCQHTDSSYRFIIPKTKNRGFGKAHEASYESFTENENICPVSNLKVYLERTNKLRASQRVLLSFKKPYKPVTSTTVARWLKETIKMAGIEGFSAHSTRAASTSAAAYKGLSAAIIMQAANWRPSGSTFQKFYWKDIQAPSYQDLVFSRKVPLNRAIVN